MGYPRSVLAPGEQVVLHRHPCARRLVGPVVTLVLGTGAAAFAAGWVSRRTWDPAAVGWATAGIGAAWLLLVLWRTAVPLARWRSTATTVTDRRLMYRHGLLTRVGEDVALTRITALGYRRGLRDRLWRTGTLVVESASRPPLDIDDVPQVAAVHRLLHQEVFDTGGVGPT